eukprot:scaffold1535_cov382-Prasinococcus_capsulatus_cf.AAC.39
MLATATGPYVGRGSLADAGRPERTQTATLFPLDLQRSSASHATLPRSTSQAPAPPAIEATPWPCQRLLRGQPSDAYDPRVY